MKCSLWLGKPQTAANVLVARRRLGDPGGPVKLFTFESRGKAFLHYAKHVKNVKYVWKTGTWKAILNGGSLAGEVKSLGEYTSAAQRFFSTTKNMISFTSKNGTLFKFNMQTGHFGVNSEGVIQTYYKLDAGKGMAYFVEQITKYGL